MSSLETNNFELSVGQNSSPVAPGANGSRTYHRLQEVRIQQGVSVRSVARKLGLTTQEVREQEDPHRNLEISQLLAWQQLLDVPLADLLVDNDAPLSLPVWQRASLLRVMKTAKAIDDAARDPKMRRFAGMLVNQLVELMPELREVAAWHTVGQRRTQDEVGRIAERTLPDSFFSDRI